MMVTRYWQWLLLGVVLTPLAVLFAQQVSPGALTFDRSGALILFPYLGIAAWTIMWTHYSGGLLRRTWTQLEPSQMYGRVSHALVTILILAHPILLAGALYAATHVKPPQSFENYVGVSAMIAVLGGTIALTIFLSYDIYRRLRSRQFWRQQAWVVAILQGLAMSLIFWHGLRLGQHLGSGWFRYWWIGLGIVLVFGLISDIKQNLDQRFPASTVDA